MAEFITLNEATDLTHAFQNSEIGNGQTFSAMFQKDLIKQILDQENCVGIRIYNALNEDQKITFVLVGYDNEDKDITEGYILDRADLCPPKCFDRESPLM